MLPTESKYSAMAHGCLALPVGIPTLYFCGNEPAGAVCDSLDPNQPSMAHLHVPVLTLER